ncbi:adenosylcobinamide-phosphate synthase CbiB [Caldimonas sp.]|uniref:adenosylcobinamide-phosphate synthase CbiB n=1 Tax=Caldimonas sp. TaxID=2838790 RepID=UPI003918D11F
MSFAPPSFPFDLALAQPGWLWSLWLGVALDALLGEPKRWHPLVGFGRWVGFIEHRLNRSPSKGRGLLAWSLAVGPIVGGFLALRAATPEAWRWGLDGLVLYAALGLRSLFEHVWPVGQALQAQDLPTARRAVQRIVTRDCSALDEAGVATAAVESTLENGSDAVFASLFWFAIAGAPGALLHRLANTLDAMWGYRTPRFLHFGWAAARIDDMLNWLPARATAFSYALLGHTRRAWRCWRAQASLWDSPNAGPVMAAGAGALSLRLGGAARYHGRVEERPALGEGERPQAADVHRACALLGRVLVLWLLVLSGLAGVAA